MDITTFLPELVRQGLLGFFCAVFLWAAAKFFLRWEQSSNDRLADAKASRDDTRAVVALASELQPLLEDHAEMVEKFENLIERCGDLIQRLNNLVERIEINQGSPSGRRR